MEKFPPELIQALRQSRHVAVLTGAGISAESGIPTFRDPQDGLWSRFRPEDLATRAAFQRDPQLVWRWYEWRRRLIRQAGPNPGHLALVRMESLLPAFSLITQNVDGLHARAGSRRPIELHGNIMRNRCFEENGDSEPVEGEAEEPPRCRNCGGWMRPDVVWFGENLPAAAIDAATDAAVGCDMFFVIGTSAAVAPASELPVLAQQAGALVVEINPEPTRLSGSVPVSLRGAAGVLLSRLVMSTWPNAVN
jgi:NAD-dependent deacetylase